MTCLRRLCFIALTVLSACATTNPQHIADLQAQENELTKKVISWDKKVEMFRAGADTLNREVMLLSNYPGWPDMLQIIKSYASIKHLEGEEQASLKREMALIYWSQKWNANGQDIYLRSRSLAERYLLLATVYHVLQAELTDLGLQRDLLLLTRVSLNLMTPDALPRVSNFYRESDRRKESELSKLIKNFPYKTILGGIENEKK